MMVLQNIIFTCLLLNNKVYFTVNSNKFYRKDTEQQSLFHRRCILLIYALKWAFEFLMTKLGLQSHTEQAVDRNQFASWN